MILEGGTTTAVNQPVTQQAAILGGWKFGLAETWNQSINFLPYPSWSLLLLYGVPGVV